MLAKRIGLIFAFVLLWIFIITALYSGLYFAGWLPSYVKDFTNDAISSVIQGPEMPDPVFSTRDAVLSIPSVGIESLIVFPTSTNEKALEYALLSGVAHYPDSAMPGEVGNVYIFGHSTGLPVVHNKSFTAFTKLHEVKEGYDLTIRSNGVSYYYRITSIETVDPKTNKVYLKSDTPILTLSTCWPVGNLADRTVVTAKYIGKAVPKKI